MGEVEEKGMSEDVTGYCRDVGPDQRVEGCPSLQRELIL